MNDADLPESLVQNEDDGFVDLDFRLVRLEALPSGGFFAEGREKHTEKL